MIVLAGDLLPVTARFSNCLVFAFAPPRAVTAGGIAERAVEAQEPSRRDCVLTRVPT